MVLSLLFEWGGSGGGDKEDGWVTRSIKKGFHIIALQSNKGKLVEKMGAWRAGTGISD